MTRETNPSGNAVSTTEPVDERNGRPGSGPTEAETIPIAQLQDTLQRIAGNVETVLVGKSEVVRLALVTLLAQGHLLVEDVPGVGKTSLAKALARSVDCTVSRIQFTPDLLPSDITGVSIYNRANESFEFRQGPVFANIVVGDEINRASPKTQSALLECMEEQQVTVDGHSYPVQRPFMVIATQNPIELEGTYALPEAQRDRFTCRISIGYPAQRAELAMVDDHSDNDPLGSLRPVTDSTEIAGLIRAVGRIHVASDVRQYAIELVSATRELSELRLGASPRATLQLLRVARAQAAISGREFVVPDDIRAVAVPVLAHRLVLSGEARAARQTGADLILRLLSKLAVPQSNNGEQRR